MGKNLWNKLTSAVQPKGGEKKKRDSFGDLGSRKTFHDHIVPEELFKWAITMKMLRSPIIADDNHAEDRARATEGPEKGVDVAEELAWSGD